MAVFKCMFVDVNHNGLYFERWSGTLESLVQWANAFPNGTLVRVVNPTVKVIPEAKRMYAFVMV